MNRFLFCFIASLFCLLLALGTSRSALGADPQSPAPRKFTAKAEVTSPGSGTRSIQVSILVDRVIPAQEVERLTGTLAEGGQWALQSAIRDRASGRLMLGAVRYPLNIITAKPTSDGFRYAAVTVRPLKVHERDTGQPSVDYPFAVFVFEVDESGRGEGELYRTATLRVDGSGQVEVESYDGEPGRLLNIEPQR